MTKCERCGRCCWYIIKDKEGNKRLKKCKHLLRNFKLGTTRCREYNKRKLLRFQNGIVIDTYKDKNDEKQHVWCVWRSNSKFNYKGCPFNVEGRMFFEDYCEKNNVVMK